MSRRSCSQPSRLRGLRRTLPPIAFLLLFSFPLSSAPVQERGHRPAEGEPADEAEKLRVDPSVSLNGKAFPEMTEVEASFPVPRRIFYISADTPEEGDGSDARPWKDLPRALCRLEPGDRLVLLPGKYSTPVSVGGACHPGRADAPIQLFGEEAFLHPAPNSFAVTASLPFWQFYHLQAVLDQPGAGGFAVVGERAQDILFDRGHLYGGDGVAISIGASSARVRISNSHIHQTGGIRIEKGARDIEFFANKIHHNRAGALAVVGGRPGAALENLTISANKFHNDLGPALSLAHCRGVRVAHNKIYNYRPRGGYRGEAILIGPGSSGVTIEGNYFAEATVAVRVGAAPGGKGPQAALDDVLLLRNYFENLLSEESVAVELQAGRRIHVFNNTMDHYAVGLLAAGLPPALSEVRIANNLVLESSGLAVHLADPAAAAYVGHNAFGRREGKTRARVGEKIFDVREELGIMPGSRTGTDVRLLSRDLANVTGIAVRDAGKPFDGLTFSGSAPDIGVAEK